MRRGQRRLVSPVAAGAIFVVVVAAICLFVFTKLNPFSNPYELKATFANATNIRTNSPVRIAGVEVGKVTKVEPAGSESTAATITMRINDNGLPIHKDAYLKIRPRIFLEGNFFVELSPGSPSAPDLPSGKTIGMTQTDGPVQLDQVLTSLQSGVRGNLQNLLQGYGGALAGDPAPGEDANADPSTRGETAAKSLNDSLNDSPAALRGATLVNEALLGLEPHDLSKLIAGAQKTSAQLASRESALKDLITNFNTTMGAFAAQDGNLRQTIALLPRVLDKAGPAFDALNRAFPPVRAFAREILPGVRESASTITASFPWIRETRALVSPAELQGLVADLKPATADLSGVTDDTVKLLPRVDLVNRCMLNVILPTGDKKIDDGFLTTGLENYKEFWQAMTSLSGESQNFDGNGQYTRFQPGGGTQTLSTGSTGFGDQGGNNPPLFGNAILQPIGTRPARPA
ncbi:MAG: phospholipid/cholesterol/gamma-HCH transport system substrate-binding protein, partial [Thermoleophilaceae bacterium]|nr:phospholipid/cholesterol/gamma-HCH transport system substrate-binding protein [Thermoleophilaceae bacterium]